MRISGFDWDAGNIDKCRKHGVSVEEIEDLFRGTPAVYADLSHSLTEQRLRAIGRTTNRPRCHRRIYDAAQGRRHLSPPDQRPLHACQGGPSP